MKNYSIFSCLLLIHVFVFGQYPDIAKTPPMGWNSWNAFGLNINSKTVMDVADSMVAKGMANVGYEYIVIDDGWQIDRDENGKIVVNAERFPEGMKYLADYIHSKGLKFGLYTCCGTETCGGLPGSYGYEEIDMQTYADWGVDFIKSDWCNTNGLSTRTQYKIMSDAIKTTGRPMILSLCEWGISQPWEWANGIGAMWRTTNDIQDCWDCLRDWGGMGWTRILELQVSLAQYAGPGHWNDPDMLEVGNWALNPTECRSHFSMWCMLAAPLIAGNNIATMNNTIRDILTAPEIIAVNQDSLGIQGTRIRNDNGLQVWRKSLSDSSVAVALLNLTNKETTMYVTLRELGLKSGVMSSVRDLWEQTDLNPITDTFQVNVTAHGVKMLKIKGETNLNFMADSITVHKGFQKSIQYFINPSNITVSVYSSNDEIIELSEERNNTYTIYAKEVGKTYITAITQDSTFIDTCFISVLPSSIPDPWVLDKIGFDEGANISPSAHYNNNIFSIQSSGEDIWGTSDQFAYVNQEISGNQSISARLISQTFTDPWAKSGLMIRESNSPNSAFMMLCATPENGLSLQWREHTGGQCDYENIGSFTLPVYIKLLKDGSTFKAYKSTNGGRYWVLLDSMKLNRSFQEPYLIGMEVVSHNTGLSNISEFDNVNIDSVASPKPPVSNIATSNGNYFQCYPNPLNKDKLTIVFNKNKQPSCFTVELITLNGISVIKNKYENNTMSSFKLDFEGVDPGTYILSIISEKYAGHIKLMIN